LGRAYCDVVAFEISAGGHDLLTTDEITICNRCIKLIRELTAVEHALRFIGVCDATAINIAELLGATGASVADNLAATSSARRRYFFAAGELKFLLRCIQKRRALAA
jgi:hypothetical protein